MPTLEAFAEVSFKLHRNTRKPSTLVRMMSNYKKHILPRFGSKKLDQIKPSMLSLWQSEMLEKQGLSPKRIRDIRSVLSVILEDAVNDELIGSNPARKMAKLPMQQAAAIEPFSFEEIKAILEAAEGHFANMFAVGFFTGMRIGEILALRWEDVNFDTATISIKATVGRGLITTPKTAGSIREIEILDVLMPYLRDQYEQTGEWGTFVFLNEANTHYFDSSKIRLPHWKNALEKAGVKYRTLYQMRHTFASMMITNGENVLWVSSMMGHTTPEMTLRRYTRYIKKDGVKHGTFLNKKFS